MRETFDEGVDAGIAAIETLMDRCVYALGDCGDNPEAQARHKAHKVAYYEALTVLEEVRRGDDGCKLRFTGTRAERLQLYLLEQAENYLAEGALDPFLLISPEALRSMNAESFRRCLLRFVAWLKEQVQEGAEARSKMLEK